VVGLFALNRYWEKSYPNFARIVFTGGLFLLYFATLRLHFFSDRPAITSEAVALALLVVVLVVQVVLAARQQSQFATGIVMVLSVGTSLISDVRLFGLTLTVGAAATALCLYKRHNWQTLLNVTIVLVYGTHLSWLLGNPAMGRGPAVIPDPGSNLVYLFICAGLFAAGNCFHYESSSTTAARIVRSILNGGGFFLLANLAGLSFSRERLALLDLLIHIFFMSAATLYWLRRRSRYSTSIYSCFGYLALSAAIFAHFPAPDYFLWLGWQSLLVAGTAIWFCSKIITVTNVFIYLGLYTTYLATAPANGWVTLNFAFIALISARLLNWQQHRLELRSELLRNIYLGAACIIVPYGLYHAVPRAWVSVSWIGATVVYFLMSRFLNNKKYRWMAIVTLLAAVAYAFIIDLARLEPVYRIISFIALGVALLIVSLFYARHRHKNSD